MKIQPDRSDRLSITAYGPNWVAVNGTTHSHHMMVSSSGLVTPWNGHPQFEDLGDQSLTVIETGCEILLLGCGKKQKFVPLTQLITFAQRNVGVECMDTAAACRTFNVLASEGRKVTAILILDASSH